jgi:hypothetical protein
MSKFKIPRPSQNPNVTHKIYGIDVTMSREHWILFELIRFKTRIPKPILYNKIITFVKLIQTEELKRQIDAEMEKAILKEREIFERRKEEQRILREQEEALIRKEKECEDRSPNGRGCSHPVKNRYCKVKATYCENIDQFRCGRHSNTLWSIF